LVVYSWRVTDKYGGTCEKSKLYYNKDPENELVGHNPTKTTSVSDENATAVNASTYTSLEIFI